MFSGTVNSHLQIALSPPGTTQFDPRPVVAQLLKYKDRRPRTPDTEL